MSKTFNLAIRLTTNANVTGARVEEILKQLIDAGLADAQGTIESGEGDIESAQLATDLNIGAPSLVPQESSVKVKYWDNYHGDGSVDTHQFDIADQRCERRPESA
jgi:hypothetical protein